MRNVHSRGGRLAACLLLAASLGCRESASPDAHPPPHDWVNRLPRGPRPDVLLVVYDARRRDDFSFGPHGNRRGDTPFLAAFEKEAASFDDAVSPGTWTVPVHASLFSGLSVCDLGNDLYSRGWATFPGGFLSLAEILKLAGYRTVAFPDHPFFYGQNPDHTGQLSLSLLRGFDLFSVVNDFGRFGVRTNIGTPDGKVVMRHTLAGPEAPVDELAAEVARFNAGKLRVSPSDEGDLDPVREVHLARLGELFEASGYLERRYLEDFDRYVFARESKEPLFLFLNLHMATNVAVPDPALYSRWCVRTLILNAAARGARLPELAGDPVAWAANAFDALGLRHEGFPDPALYLKQVFDNRFYDASFEGVWRYLEAKGRTRNMLTVVTSDHGMSFSENGEDFYLHDGARPYEYITRVPLVVRFPKGSPETARHGHHSRRVSLTDVFSTVLDVALGEGVFERSLPIRGRSLLARGQEGATDEVEVVNAMASADDYAREPEAAGHARAVYWKDFKLVLMPDPWRVRESQWPTNLPLDGTFERAAGPSRNQPLGHEVVWLFDLSADPHESQDLSKARPDTVAAIRSLPAADGACRPLGLSMQEDAGDAWDPEALETLRALGYVE